jgi:hypothetical protein
MEKSTFGPSGSSEAAQILRPGGVMKLGVPIARDAVVWNAHLVYGRAPLRLLLQG